MKDLTPQQESERIFSYFWSDELITIRGTAKRYAKFTAQQIADNTTGATKIFYLEVIKEIEKL